MEASECLPGRRGCPPREPRICTPRSRHERGGMLKVALSDVRHSAMRRRPPRSTAWLSGVHRVEQDPYFASTTLRLTFMLGVSSSSSTERSWSRMRKSLIVSQRLSRPLSSSTQACDVAVDRRVRGERGVLGRAQAPAPGAHCASALGIQRDQRGGVVAAVAVHQDLAGQRADRLEHDLDRLRRDVLAAGGLDQVLLPVGDRSRPAASSSPTSPVANQPSASSTSAVAAGRLW